MSEATAAARTVAGTLSDEEVVRRVCAGEHALFEILMRRYNQRLYRVARSILKDEAEAEDVMQQAYVNAFTHLASSPTARASPPGSPVSPCTRPSPACAGSGGSGRST